MDRRQALKTAAAVLVAPALGIGDSRYEFDPAKLVLVRQQVVTKYRLHAYEYVPPFGSLASRADVVEQIDDGFYMQWEFKYEIDGRDWFDSFRLYRSGPDAPTEAELRAYEPFARQRCEPIVRRMLEKHRNGTVA